MIDTSTELLCKDVAKSEQKCQTDKSDSSEGEDSDYEKDDDNEDDEEYEDGSENGVDSDNSSKKCEIDEDFEASSDDDNDAEYESESTDLLPTKVGVTEHSVNSDLKANVTEKKSVHLRIEDIDFMDTSTNKEYNNSKTTEDLSAMADVMITDTNTETDMLLSGGNFVAGNPERSGTGIDFLEYNGGKEMVGCINVLSNKIDSKGKKESSVQQFQ